MIKLSFVSVIYNNPSSYLLNWFDNLMSLRYYLLQFELDFVLVNTGKFDYDLSSFNSHEINYQYYKTKNLGYCGGNNFGIEKANGDFIVILNPNICIQESLAIDWLYSISVQHDRKAITGCYNDGINNLVYPAMFPVDKQYSYDNLPYCYDVNPQQDKKFRVFPWKSLPFIDGSIMGFFKDIWTQVKFDQNIFPGYFGENIFQYEAQRKLGVRLLNAPIKEFIKNNPNTNIRVEQKKYWTKEARTYFYKKHALPDYDYFLSQLI